MLYYYYSLPTHPFGENYQFNNPVYSNKYGLILLGYKSRTNEIAFLNFDNQQDILKWKIEKLSNPIHLSGREAPNYVLINNGSKLFIVNGKQ